MTTNISSVVPSASSLRLRYNKNEEAGELVEKTCVTCQVKQQIPTNYINCKECDVKNIKLKALRHKEAQSKLRKKQSELADSNAKQVAAGIAVAPVVLTCERCHQVPIKRPDHYCPECREAVQVERMAKSTLQKNEQYHIKKALRAKSVLDEMSDVLESFSCNNTEKINTYTRVQIMKALELYFGNLKDDELRAVVAEILFDSESEPETDVTTSGANKPEPDVTTSGSNKTIVSDTEPDSDEYN